MNRRKATLQGQELGTWNQLLTGYRPPHAPGRTPARTVTFGNAATHEEEERSLKRTRELTLRERRKQRIRGTGLSITELLGR